MGRAAARIRAEIGTQARATDPALVRAATTSARQLGQGLPDKRRLAFARSMVAAAVAECWRVTVGSRRRHRPVGCDIDALDDRHADVSRALGAAAASLPVEHAAYVLGSTYAGMLPESIRSSQGVFYTPPDIAGRLLDQVTSAGINWRSCTVLDPACGGGAFLSPVVSRIVEANRRAGRSPEQIVEHVGTHVRGFEIDPFAAWMSQVFVDLTLFTALGGEGYARTAVVETCDSMTRAAMAQRFDVIIGNPPYGRVRLTADQRTTFARSLFGHANLYTVFLDLAARWIEPSRGVIGYVTPASFLSGEYFKKLRSTLARDAAPVSIGFVEKRHGIFDDVLQETVLVVCSPRAKERTEVSFISTTSSGLTATSAGSYPLPDDRSAPWVLPRRPHLADTARQLEKAPARLRDWGYAVSTGPLVWNRHKPQMRQTKVAGSVPLIWAESVSPDGRFEFRAARRNHAPYFVPEKGDEWLLVRRACVLLQRTTATEQPRRLIAAELPSAFIEAHEGAVTVENHLNMLVPLTKSPAVAPATLAAFLNSTAADNAFRCINGSVAVSAFELEAMPLPGLERMRAVSDALARDAAAGELEALCQKLYT